MRASFSERLNRSESIFGLFVESGRQCVRFAESKLCVENIRATA